MRSPKYLFLCPNIVRTSQQWVKPVLIWVLSLTFGIGLGMEQPVASGSHSKSGDGDVHRFGNICIITPWAFDSLGKNVGAAFMAIAAREGFSDVLLAASSPQAENVMLHDTVINDGVMMMQHVDRVPLSSEVPIILQPHGLHVMLTRMTDPLTSHSDLQIQLDFEKTGTIHIRVDVRDLAEGIPIFNIKCE